MNGNVNIRIFEKNPTLRILNNFGEDFLIDKNGIMLAKTKMRVEYLKVVTGDINQRFIRGEKIRHKSLIQTLNIFHSLTQDKDINNLIGQYYIDNKGNTIIYLPKYKLKVLLGNSNKILEKIKNLRIFLTQILPNNKESKYGFIKLNFTNQIIASK